MPGPLVLVGGQEWAPGCEPFDKALIAAGLSAPEVREVIVLPTAAAYEGAEAVGERAVEWFAKLGARARVLMVLGRRDAEDLASVELVRRARAVYLSDGSALHLRSVLKSSSLLTAITEAWWSGAAVAASGAAASVLCDPMVDPRGGAYTVGLGLLARLAVVGGFGSWSQDKRRRVLELAPKGTAVAGVDPRTALVRLRDGTFQVMGAAAVSIVCDGAELGPAELAATVPVLAATVPVPAGTGTVVSPSP
ncbi:MAG: Type 1 glutamine amidotransferase-like domain-containing protein [Acidimicrobiales bacterium]